MILFLIITNIITLGGLGYVSYLLYRAATYAKKADLERLTLAIENGELEEERDSIAFK